MLRLLLTLSAQLLVVDICIQVLLTYSQHSAFLPQVVLALNQRVIPPTFNCFVPNPIFDAEAAMLYPVREGRQLPADVEMYAGPHDIAFCIKRVLFCEKLFCTPD